MKVASRRLYIDFEKTTKESKTSDCHHCRRRRSLRERGCFLVRYFRATIIAAAGIALIFVVGDLKGCVAVAFTFEKLGLGDRGRRIPFRQYYRPWNNPYYPYQTLPETLYSSTMGRSDDNNTQHNDAPVVLLIGSCGLDRLLTVPKYPAADAKIRTMSYNEVGGGNSANTASAIGKLVDAKIFCSSPSFSDNQRVRVQFLSKVGDDTVGQQLIDELNASNVDTTSPLFRVGQTGTTTAFTTIIVSETEQTRSCIHTPGTCGELSITEDIQSLSPDDIDDVFRNVVHLHSDSRHTDVSLWMAKEAKRRGITVSVDCEKDRNAASLDELIEICDILFTNSNHLGEYLERLTREQEAAAGIRPLVDPTIVVVGDDGGATTDLASSSLDPQEKELLETCVRSLGPSTYFARWQEQKDTILGKQVVVTHGSMGALHFKPIELSIQQKSSSSGTCEPYNRMQIKTDESTVRIRHSFDNGNDSYDILYDIYHAGVLKNPKIVDTTGAGDAFIGGYILTWNTDFEKNDVATDEKTKLALDMGSFVGGRKLGGPGGRSALPSGADVDDMLGSNVADVRASLRKKLGLFNNRRN